MAVLAGHGGSSGASVGGTGGTASGGAIYGAANSTIVLQNSTVSGNQTAGGFGGTATNSNGGTSPGLGGNAYGAITAGGSALTITDSTIAGNTTTAGSAGSTRAVTANLSSGGAAYGGAMVGGATMTIVRSTVAGNSATGGGGEGNGRGGPNGSASGGGMLIQGTATVVNSTISGNRATGEPGSSGSANPTQGGGIMAGQLTLASVTLADNSVAGPSSTGGNLYGTNTAIAFGDTLIAGGSATTSGNNCALASGVTPTDNGNNLEDTSPSQCGLATVHSDLIGMGAALEPLASNGGPTQTRALASNSPALGAGGTCTDPSQIGNPALAVDQRVLPRPSGACDIGAFQLQPPQGSGAPQISGTPAVGQSLACSEGSWSGDELTFAYQWLRDGAQIQGEAAANYTVVANDAGHQLTCKVTTSNPKGTASQTSLAVSVPSPPASTSPPSISGTTAQGQLLTESHGAWSGNPSAYAYQWEDCDGAGNNCAAIGMATDQTYNLAPSDVGHTIRVQETATNAGGPSAPATSSATGVVTAPTAPRSDTPPTISGVAAVGHLLTCMHGTWSGTPPISYSYQWLRNGTPIVGATSLSYTVTSGDAARSVACKVTASNSTGSASAPSSAMSVPGEPPRPTAAKIKAALLASITPPGKLAKIGAIVKAGGFVLSFKALEAGRAIVSWYLLPKGAKLAAARKPVLIATGRLSFRARRLGKLMIKLTVAGRKLLNKSRSVSLTARGTFISLDGASTATKTFTLER